MRKADKVVDDCNENLCRIATRKYFIYIFHLSENWLAAKEEIQEIEPFNKYVREHHELN